MTRNKNKIIRSVTVSQSLGFCREVMIKMRAMGVYKNLKNMYSNEDLERFCFKYPTEA